jgi:K+-sensing histidine kinase KdpD
VLSGANKNDNSKILNSLASDLKRPLVLIARQAELSKSRPGKKHLQSIQETAEKTLKLIDSYLLMSQSEYGQQLLPVESFGIGSVIYNVAEEIRPIAKKANIDIILNINDALVMANPGGLKAIIWCLSDMALAQTSAEQTSGVVEINTKKSINNIRISVLSKSMKIKNSDLDKAQKNIGKTHMALSSSSSDSGIRLAIASLLGESLGTSLRAVRDKRTQGIGFNLALSRQLQLGLR